jgi:serine/threonine-protein kinase OSR1/STK39
VKTNKHTPRNKPNKTKKTQMQAIATIMRDVLSALAYVHRHSGIHRDVKAGNVLIGSDGRVALGDFGVAATMERGGEWGGSGPVARSTFVGTPCWVRVVCCALCSVSSSGRGRLGLSTPHLFRNKRSNHLKNNKNKPTKPYTTTLQTDTHTQQMAPEVLEQTRYGPPADIWSFGITLLEMAHGHAPFAKFPPMKVLLMTLQGPPPTLEAQCGARHFSRAMREVVALCLQKDPARRPTAAKLLEHRFWRHARDAGYLKRHLLEGMPPLAQRHGEIRAGAGGAATRALDNELRAAASQVYGRSAGRGGGAGGVWVRLLLACTPQRELSTS